VQISLLVLLEMLRLLPDLMLIMVLALVLLLLSYHLRGSTTCQYHNCVAVAYSIPTPAPAVIACCKHLALSSSSSSCYPIKP
jgi:hypothetical protein